MAGDIQVVDKSGNSDPVVTRGSEETFSSKRATAITPSDTAQLARPTRAIYVGGTGNVRVETIEGNDVLFTAVPVGSTIPVQARKVFSTSTTATALVALH